MMAVHELGHVLHAIASDGVVARVVVGPFEMSRTDLWRNPHPAFVAAGGVVWGAILPFLVSLTVPAHWAPGRHLARFFAGFCLAANGVYLLVGGLHDGGDPGDLRHFGVPLLPIMFAGLIETTLGLRVWHGLGPRLGFGVHADQRPCRTALVLLVLLGAVVAFEILLSPQKLKPIPTSIRVRSVFVSNL
jgi:hypothetical protein